VPQHRIESPLVIVQAPGDTVLLWPTWTPKRFIPDTTAWDRDAIVQRIDESQREIVVQLLTYSPNGRDRVDDAIDQALRRAGARGVHVRLLISDWEADGAAIGTLQKLSQAPGVEAKLGTVPPWSGGYIPFARVEHCKYMVVDSLWTWVGTANWEPSYFYGTRNLGVVMRNRPIALDARKIFEASWTAEGAAAVRPDARYERKEHGLTPPAGMKAYGN
jgi:phosphatidylserine/phosphatidylglycerophosphate/cardiolipin synthase-like enzyme